ncbi:hypothetical protein [Actinophytocola oryzae]|uniref:hypothetical protein n=1 Tax=Actinophytocola oryzae TaxID=502181 RepID=UPI001062F7A5|nr:hypothetical protein [Actinophytocola oryzae]
MELVGELNRLRTWAGQPSLRRLEKLSGESLGEGATELLPSSTTSEVLAGKRLPRPPRLAFVESFVTACLRARGLDGDTVEQVVDRWRAAWRVVQVKHTTPPEPFLPQATSPERQAGPRRARLAAAVCAAVFATGVVVGVAGTRMTHDDIGHPVTPATGRTRGAVCRPLDQPHATGALIMGAPGTPPTGEEYPRDWWANVPDVELVTDTDGFTAVVPRGFTLPWQAIVIRSAITLTAGHHYSLDFVATANRPVDIHVRVQDKTPPRYQPSLVESVPVGITPCRRTYNFTAGATSETTGEVTFQLGAQGAYTIMVEDPILVEIK